ncbi:MAG: D-2-hydroxyacid dehydrogenase [Lachnospiraceae bacterium]|nr:D-2-hydroxyacid dehydrogenase [Lachnospiraceae bacterium]
MSDKRVIAVDMDVLREAEKNNIIEEAGKLGFEVIFSGGQGFEGFEDAEVIYGGPQVLSSGINLDRLKWFHSSYAGVNAFLVPGLLPGGVVLSGSSGAFGVAIAEHGMMLTLDLIRNMPKYQERVRNRIWSHDLSFNSIYGSRVTLLGTGDIGSEYAKRIRPFCPESITGVNRSGRVGDENKDLYDRIVTSDQLDSVLPETDILFMSLPGTKETDRIIDGRRIALMPRNAFIINVGRGNSIDQKALCDSLEKEVIAGAGIDVFETEPLPENDPAWDTKNLLITTHCAGWMDLDYTRRKNMEIFLEYLKAYSKGDPVPGAIDRAVGY